MVSIRVLTFLGNMTYGQKITALEISSEYLRSVRDMSRLAANALTASQMFLDVMDTAVHIEFIKQNIKE